MGLWSVKGSREVLTWRFWTWIGSICGTAREHRKYPASSDGNNRSFLSHKPDRVRGSRRDRGRGYEGCSLLVQLSACS